MAGLEGELMLSSDSEGEEQQPDHVEGLVEVKSKAEKKRRFMWIKRHEVKIKGKVEHKPQLIALMQGSVPENVFNPCLGYKYVSVYNEPPVLRYKCGRWGHMQCKCRHD
ncbi:hypothetical protein SK128_024210 [Halocaridina rubra]|uniref:Uncharacterized protein n=1 Tax=Halocaridina rubra TaxID=373956 RepID=A0AAN8WKG8_HALRR